MTTSTHHAPRRTKRPTPKPVGAENFARADSDSSVSPSVPFIEPDRRHAMISDAAYFLSEKRDFCPGHELDDWLTAEREIDRQLSSAHFETGWRRSFADRLRARSQALRSEIHDTLLRTDAEQYARIAGEVRDTEEDAVADLLVDVNMAEITRDVEELRDIEAAFGRIASGMYGVCVSCSEPIARERLEAYPTAKRCIPCQRRHDQSRATPPPPSL